MNLFLDTEASFAASQYRQNAEGCIKTAEDLARYRRVLAESQPDLIIECGTAYGGSALWFSRFAPVITIDILDRVGAEVKAAWDGRVTQIIGDSVSGAVLNEVCREHLPARVMVVLDSLHLTSHVRAEIRAYGPLVTPGCYLVVEDGICAWIPGEGPGPLPAIEEALYGHPNWIRDEEVESMFPVTMHPAGWWRRK